MENIASEDDPELDAQPILLAASNHNIEALRALLRKGSANVEDADTGFTPLHSAIAACEPSSPNLENDQRNPAGFSGGHGQSTPIISGGFSGVNESARSMSNGQGETRDQHERSAVTPSNEELENAEKTVRLLFQNGAIWNDLDKNNETPGCLARRLGLTSLYEIVVDAGVRAEILLNRLDGYDLLRGDDSDEGQEGIEEMVNPDESTTQFAQDIAANEVANDVDDQPEEPPQVVVAEPAAGEVTSEGYLNSSLTFGGDRILDQDNNGVMMAWETGIMQRTADLLIPVAGLRVLNIGHGMGIIDDFFQEKSPSIHHIIEAHPTVIDQLKKNGWDKKSGVAIHEGKWQDVVPKLIEEGTLFDAIYFDTFAEDYKALHSFFEESVIGLLDDGGRWGFFNGLGADRQVCYDVYSKVVEIDLLEAGYDVEWETMQVQDLEQSKQWEGVRRPYWQLESYKLPICTFIG